MQTTAPGAVTSPHLPVRPDWLDRRREEIIEPDLPIVDPHHHLVDRPETGRYLLPELLADTGSGHNITATVYLEWLSMYRAEGPVEMRPVAKSSSPTVSQQWRRAVTTAIHGSAPMMMTCPAVLACASPR